LIKINICATFATPQNVVVGWMEQMDGDAGGQQLWQICAINKHFGAVTALRAKGTPTVIKQI